MASLNIVKTKDKQNFEVKWGNLLKKLTLESALLDYTERLETVRNIINQVRTGGDNVVIEKTSVGIQNG